MTYCFRFKCLNCSLLLAFLLFFQMNLKAQVDLSGLDKILMQNDKFLGKNKLLVVQKDGKTIFLKETEDFKLKMPAPVGASSKWLTAALVMIFVDEGKLSLDDQVSKYIPIFSKYMKGYITLRHCLSQTVGLDTDAAGLVKFTQKTRYNTLEEEMEYFATKKLIVDNPGEAFADASVGLNIAGRVLEVITKKTFDRVAQEKLFRPLMMKTSSFYDEEGKAPNPSGGASCSAFDYMNFLTMIANKGMFNGKKVLSAASVGELLKNQFPDARIRYNPELTKGFTFAMGAWMETTSSDGKGLRYSCGSPTGAWPWIDLNNRTIGMFLPEKPLAVINRAFYEQLIAKIEAVIN